MHHQDAKPPGRDPGGSGWRSGKSHDPSLALSAEAGKTLDLFDPPKRLSKRALRRIKNAWRADVGSWAESVLSHDLLLEYADPDNELTVISIMGDGPPKSWRKRILEKLAADLAAIGKSNQDVYEATNPALVKTAIRIGRLPRSILSTMPPRPRELAPS
jgi:hypothetical protein